jgi:hypothetical protein
MNSLSRFTAHRLSIDGMHSAGMQPEGAGGFLPSDASLRDATLPGLFCGSVIGSPHILQADKQKEMTKTIVIGRNAVTKPSGAARSVDVPAAAVCSVPVRTASRRDASPGRTAHRPPLHSVRNASFDEFALPFYSASTKHRRDAFRRNATGGGRRFFYRATHPSGMQLCRGFFCGSVIGTCAPAGVS